MTRARTQRPTLPAQDEAKLKATSAELDAAIEDADRCSAAAVRLADDVDSERLSVDGIVLDPLDEEDSLVIHIRESIRGLGAV